MPEVKARRQLTKRQRARLVAGREPVPAYNARSIFMGILAVLVVGAAVLFFLNRETILANASSDQVSTEVCTVTKVNDTREFQTSCGRFIWGESLGATPYLVLKIGDSYSFTAAGPRFPLVGFKPTVISYTPAPAPAP